MADREITFVTWLWQSPDPATRLFKTEHVNILYAMLKRHSPAPVHLVCVTDDPNGLDPEIEAFPIPVTRLEHLPSPHGNRNKTFPICYRRLWMFSDAAKILGDRVFLLDIDVVITGDLSPLLAMKGDFVGWTDHRFGWPKIAGGAYILNTGSHPEVWDDFDPDTSPEKALRAGNRGSDQAWISYKLHPPEKSFGSKDGVIKLNWLPRGGQPPPKDVRMVFFSGNRPPWHSQVQAGYTWIKEHWRL